MSLIELTIAPREKDLGGFSIQRLLPFAKRRMVGPFIFLDHIGPAQFSAGHGIDVRPHPHIGLATVTYLFAGEFLHRDTLGSERVIAPGAVNWMTAGSGIAHSERTPDDERGRPHAIHGLQSWIALPKSHEGMAPSFRHHPAEELPQFNHKGVSLKLIAGRAYNNEAPVAVASPLFYVEAKMTAGSSLTLPPEYRERALYLVSGAVRIGGARIETGTLPVFAPSETVTIEAEAPSHLMLLGGDPLSEPRFIWWNFVSSSQEKIEQAKVDWAAGRFGTIPGDSDEFIPLPAA